MMIFKIGVMKMYPVQVPRYKRFSPFFFLSLCSYVSLFIHFRIIVKKTHIKTTTTTTTTTKQILLE